MHHRYQKHLRLTIYPQSNYELNKRRFEIKYSVWFFDSYINLNSTTIMFKCQYYWIKILLFSKELFSMLTRLGNGDLRV